MDPQSQQPADPSVSQPVEPFVSQPEFQEVAQQVAPQIQEALQSIPSQNSALESKEGIPPNPQNLQPADLGGQHLNVAAAQPMPQQQQQYQPPKPQFPQGKVTITVSDPQNVGDSMKQHTSYKVTTNVVDDRNGTLHVVLQAQVERRYSDFLWLAEILRQKFVGSLIPPLPEKKTIGRFEADVLQQRMKGFVSFLARCCSHPNKAIKQCEEFLVFLQGTQQEFEAAKARTSKEHTSSEKFSRWLSEAVASLSSKPSNPENDRHYSYALHLEQSIDSLQSNLEEQIKKTKGEAVAWQEISKSAQSLAEYENKSAHPNGQASGLPIAQPVSESKEGEPSASSSSSSVSPSAPIYPSTQIGNLLSRFSESAEQIAKITALKADNEHIFLSDPLRDLYNYCESVKAMIKERLRLDTKYQENVVLLAKQTTKLQTSKDEKQREQLRQQVDELSQTVHTMQDTLKTIGDAIEEEMKRFNAEKEKEIQQALLSFVRDQIEQSKKQQEAWQSLLEKIQ